MFYQNLLTNKTGLILHKIFNREIKTDFFKKNSDCFNATIK